MNMKIQVYVLSPSYILYRLNNQVFILHEKGIAIDLTKKRLIVPRFMYIQVLRGIRIAKRLKWIRHDIELIRMEMYQLDKHLKKYYYRALRYGDTKNMKIFHTLMNAVQSRGAK